MYKSITLILKEFKFNCRSCRSTIKSFNNHSQKIYIFLNFTILLITKHSVIHITLSLLRFFTFCNYNKSVSSLWGFLKSSKRRTNNILISKKYLIFNVLLRITQIKIIYSLSQFHFIDTIRISIIPEIFLIRFLVNTKSIIFKTHILFKKTLF